MSAATIRGFAGVGDSTTTGVENASRVSVGARGERRTEVVGNSTRLNEHVPSGDWHHDVLLHAGEGANEFLFA